MRDRLLFAASALARIVLVIAAFAIAVGSIALSSVRGFCPEIDEQALTLTLAAASTATVPLATIVEEPTQETAPEPGAPTQPEEPPADGQEAPADGGEVPAESGGACPGGATRCLPPLFSSILIIGEPTCHDQAPAVLRSILVPAFVGSTVLLAAAWWLRPGRLPGSTEDAPVDATRGTR